MRGKWSQSDWTQIMRTAVRASFPAIGAAIEGQAVELAPILTGRLRGSITYATPFDRDQPRHPAKSEDAVSVPTDEWMMHVGTNVDYAEYQEYGTVRSPAQPYLRPALDRYHKHARRYFANAIKKAIAQYGK